MSFLSKVLGKINSELDSLLQHYNQSVEILDNEVCRYDGPCTHKKNLPRLIPPYGQGIYPSPEFSSDSIVVYLDVCMKGIGKDCKGPGKESDINFLLKTEEKMVEF